MNTCCFSGHRVIPEEKLLYVRTRLYEEIVKTIQDGYTRFVSGFANGTDLMAAELVLDLKQYYPGIKLQAAIPYPGNAEKKNPYFQNLLRRCDEVIIVSDHYTKWSMHKRNAKMIEESDRLIAVYDERKTGGTKYTIDLANKKGIEVIKILLPKEDQKE